MIVNTPRPQQALMRVNTITDIDVRPQAGTGDYEGKKQADR